MTFCDAAAFDGRPDTTAMARDFADGFLARAADGQGTPVTEDVAGAVRLVVSELVTNASRYAPGPFLLELVLTDKAVRVSVCDREPMPPAPREPDPARVGQHGLEIVLALCSDFSVHPHAGGKRVSALIPTS